MLTDRVVPPTAPVVGCGSAVCHVGEGIQAIKPDPVLTTKFSAIGKYPHLAVSEDTVDFGEVQIGTKGVSNSRHEREDWEGQKTDGGAHACPAGWLVGDCVAAVCLSRRA